VHELTSCIECQPNLLIHIQVESQLRRTEHLIIGRLLILGKLQQSLLLLRQAVVHECLLHFSRVDKVEICAMELSPHRLLHYKLVRLILLLLLFVIGLRNK